MQADIIKLVRSQVRSDRDMAIVAEARDYQRRIDRAIKAGVFNTPRLTDLSRYLRHYRSTGFVSDLAWFLMDFREAIRFELASAERLAA